MKTNRLLLTVFSGLLLISANVNAFTYYITFTGSGASTAVDSVIAFNLSKGTQVKIPAGVTLQLYDVENSVENLNTTSDLAAVFPNPVTDKATFTFMAKSDGSTQVAIYSLDGRKQTGLDLDLKQGKHSLELLLPVGAYLVQAKGKDYSYTVRTICFSRANYRPTISLIGNTTRTKPQKVTNPPVLEAKLQYNTGDQILYRGYSGIYCTIVTDKPTETKTTDFKFVDCTDADGNHYAVVHIGTQTWMAENLKTTRYQNHEEIGTTTGEIPNDATSKYQWAYGGNEENVAKYSRLYTWWAAADRRNIAPAGWHVPTDAEWTTLENYMIASGYNYDGSTTGNKIAKSLAATTDWISQPYTGAIGNDLCKNNSSGFSALPVGSRNYNGTFGSLGNYCYWWSSTETSDTHARYRYMDFNHYDLINFYGVKKYGFSVRCVRDNYANQINIETVNIPAGTFNMGSPVTEVNRFEDETQHQVTLSAFRMSKYEITNAQFAAFLNAKGIGRDGISSVDANPIIYASSGFNDFGLHYTGSEWIPVAGYENHPVINVSWYGAAEFAAYIGGALPTEAQWEYACRGGTTTPFNTGGCLTNLQANYNWSGAYYTCENSVTMYPGKTQAVGTYPPNGYELYDMHGNVWEFCADRYERNYPTSPQTNPTGPVTGDSIVIRGGSWAGYAQYCRSAQRGAGSGPSVGSGAYGGFRVVFVP